MIRLKVSKNDDKSILLEAIEGIDHFGFGTFLCNLQPEEIEADEFSKNALLSAREKSGLNGMEVFGNNVLSWGDPRHKIIMPICEVSKDKEADGWLSKIVAVL